MRDLDLDLLTTRVGIDPAQHAVALEALASGSAAWVVVSGKMCAGKDTVAPELISVMPSEPTMLRYGNLMRAELDPGLDLIREALRNDPTLESRRDLAAELAEVMDLTDAQVDETLDRLVPEMIASDLTLTAHARTEGVRVILQNLGDDWRCLEDEDYWARKAAIASLEAIGAGKSVILTGGRFLPDVDMPRAAGAILLRLDVDRSTQLDRLRGRDNLDPSAETLTALDHDSETALDGYAHFDIHVDNNGTLEVAILASKTAVVNHLAIRQARVA